MNLTRQEMLGIYNDPRLNLRFRMFFPELYSWIVNSLFGVCLDCGTESEVLQIDPKIFSECPETEEDMGE